MITGKHIKNMLVFLLADDILSELRITGEEEMSEPTKTKTKAWETTIAEAMKTNASKTSAPVLTSSIPYGVFYSQTVEDFHKKNIKIC